MIAEVFLACVNGTARNHCDWSSVRVERGGEVTKEREGFGSWGNVGLGASGSSHLSLNGAT